MWPQICWQPLSSCGTRAGNEPKKWPVSDCCRLVAQIGKGLPHLGLSMTFFFNYFVLLAAGKSDAPRLGCSTRDGRVRPSRGALLLLRRMGTGGRKAKPWGVFTQQTHKDRARTRGAGAFAFGPCPSSEPAPGAPGPSVGTNGRRAGDGSGHPRTASAGASQRSQGFDMREGTSWTHRGSWGLWGIPRDAWTPPGRTQPGPGPSVLPDLFPPLFFPWNSPPSFGQLLFPSQKGLSVQVSPLPPFPAIVMLKSPGHVSAKN